MTEPLQQHPGGADPRPAGVLGRDVCASHALLRNQLERARRAVSRRDPSEPRAARAPVDVLLTSASQHAGAVLAVLVPRTRAVVPDGPAAAEELVHRVRDLEVALHQLKGKTYGNTFMARRHYDEVWDEVSGTLHRLVRAETAAGTLLASAPGSGADHVAALHRAEERAPSRPHPWIPHQGPLAPAARAVARRLDAFYDTVEGRMLPEPAPHHDREHDGLFTQWLLADPHLAPPERHDHGDDPTPTGR